MNQHAYRKIGLATLILMASIFLSRLLGVVRESTIAAVAGAGTAVDAYRVAFVLPEILNHILASGFLSVTFIPIFSRYLARGDEEGGWRIFSIILSGFGLVLAILIGVSMVFAPQLVPLLAAGRHDPLFIAMAVRMTRITLPAQFFFFAGGLLMAVQFAKERFATPALAPLVYNFGIISGGLVLGKYMGVEGFAWGALAGSLLGNFLIQLAGACKEGLRFRFVLDFSHPDLRRYVYLTLPLMFGLTMTFSTEIFSKFFGSFLSEGAIAWIDYAMRVMLLLVAFFGQAVGVASYPYMARLVAEGRLSDMNQLLNKTMRYLSLVWPVSLLAIVLRTEIVRILFQRGRFGPTDTEMTSLAIGCLLIGSVAFSAQTVVSRGFYAIQNTLLPAIYGTIAVILSLPLYWIGVRAFGVAGLGSAISFSAFVQVIVLYVAWNRRSQNTGSTAVYAVYGKTVLASLPVGGILWGVHKYLVQWLGEPSFAGSCMIIVAVSVLFVILMAAWGWLFKVEGIQYIWERIYSRFQSTTSQKHVSRPH